MVRMRQDSPCVAVLVAVLMLLAGLAAASPDALQQRVDEWVGARKSRAMAVAMITTDTLQLAFAGHTGNRENPDPTAETLFEIGSITKVFTGWLLADCVARGEVTLDSTVGELMPGERELDPAVASITLRELAMHTSGLPRLATSGPMMGRLLFKRSDPYAGSTADEIYDAVAALKATDLGSRDQSAYSNLGMALLGRLLESAAGESYETLVRNRLLEPTGMEATRFLADSLGDPMLARGHTSALRPGPNWQLDGYNPAGGLVSNLDDMVLFARAAIAANDNALADSMAGELAWQVGRRGPTPAWWHNGMTGGYYSFIGIIPDRGIAVIVLSNTASNGDEFGISLLRGTQPYVPGTIGIGVRVGLTLGFLMIAPFVVWNRRREFRATVAGTIKRPRGRIHLVDAFVDATFVLAISWKLGSWNILPEAIWWLGLVGTGGLMVSGVRAGRPLPWWPAVAWWRHVWTVIAIALTTVLLLIVLWLM